MTRADELRQRAREVEDHAWAIRWSNPGQYRALTNIAREIQEIAANLPPERATE